MWKKNIKTRRKFVPCLVTRHSDFNPGNEHLILRLKKLIESYVGFKILPFLNHFGWSITRKCKCFFLLRARNFNLINASLWIDYFMSPSRVCTVMNITFKVIFCYKTSPKTTITNIENNIYEEIRVLYQRLTKTKILWPNIYPLWFYILHYH